MFGHEEAVCKMGPAFSHSQSQKRARVIASEQCNYPDSSVEYRFCTTHKKKSS